MTIYSVLVEHTDCDGDTVESVGTVSSDTLDGQDPMSFDVLNVHLRDENGNPVEVEGTPVSILDEQEDYL